MNSQIKIKTFVAYALFAAVLSACASSPAAKKRVAITGANQIVELGDNKSCRVVKTGARNFQCVPTREIASRPKFR